MTKKPKNDISDFMHFLGIEEENKIKNCVNLGADFWLIHNLDILYNKALECIISKKEQEIPVFLFLNTHREFYLAMACFLRGHYTKSFCNLRAALDSVFTACYLLKFPEKKEIYLAHISPDSVAKEVWNKIFRNIKATVNKDIGTYHPLVKNLVAMHECCSVYSHADAVVVLTRCIEDRDESLLKAAYFDYEDTEHEYKQWLGILLKGFFEIFCLFWEILFKEQASAKITENLNFRGTKYKEALQSFLKKYPLKSSKKEKGDRCFSGDERDYSRK
ncbi:MAG: hypothetical protein ABIJ15_00340 [bacterium]